MTKYTLADHPEIICNFSIPAKFCGAGANFNMPDIPNKKYNEKRWRTVQIIKQYLKSNPDDIWAKSQVDLLLNLPNIQRGGAFGNEGLMHQGIFHSNIKTKAENNKP